jgi:hypothetical protein
MTFWKHLLKASNYDDFGNYGTRVVECIIRISAATVLQPCHCKLKPQKLKKKTKS